DENDGAGLCAPIRCLWYDTEQSEQSTQDILKNRILRMINPPSTLSARACSLNPSSARPKGTLHT
ncbi:MAG: hypothetical protein IKO85_09180, partial [Bacteroidaceae bacterium]|nr:hypothetical protein [Bacteroidaceae bacterium]